MYKQIEIQDIKDVWEVSRKGLVMIGNALLLHAIFQNLRFEEIEPSYDILHSWYQLLI